MTGNADAEGNDTTAILGERTDEPEHPQKTEEGKDAAVDVERDLVGDLHRVEVCKRACLSISLTVI